MLFSDRPRTHYNNAPVHEVICQLRFPTILSINNTEPADFQEAIRDEFPRYSRRQDAIPPKAVKMPDGKVQLQQQPPVTNYTFLSADGKWKINLTRDFIALSTLSYTDWEDFARHLDKPLASFIQIYKPAYFERVGLRYINFISRGDLGLPTTPFRELIEGCWLGPMAEEDVQETGCGRCSIDVEMAIRGGCRAKIHAGPGKVQRSGKMDPEVKFIFDQDLFMPGQVPVNLSAGALQTLHAQAWSIFRGAITEKLHDALEPR